MSSPGFFKQWGNNIAETGHPEMTENRIKNEQNNLDFKIAPLRQQLAADQERLKTLVDSVGQPKLDENGKHADYDLIESRMAKTIGDIRKAAGDKVPSDHPGRMAETVNGIRQWLKMGGKNKQKLQAAQTGKVNDWNNQNTQMASQASVGALPFEQTAQGQAEAVKSRDALELQRLRNQAPKGAQGRPVPFGKGSISSKDAQEMAAGGMVFNNEQGDPIDTTKLPEGTKITPWAFGGKIFYTIGDQIPRVITADNQRTVQPEEGALSPAGQAPTLGVARVPTVGTHQVPGMNPGETVTLHTSTTPVTGGGAKKSPSTIPTRPSSSSTPKTEDRSGSNSGKLTPQPPPFAKGTMLSQGRQAQPVVAAMNTVAANVFGGDGEPPIWDNAWMFDKPELKTALNKALTMNALKIPGTGDDPTFMQQLATTVGLTGASQEQVNQAIAQSRDDLERVGGPEAMKMFARMAAVQEDLSALRSATKGSAAQGSIQTIVRAAPVYNVSSSQNFRDMLGSTLNTAAAAMGGYPAINPEYINWWKNGAKSARGGPEGEKLKALKETAAKARSGGKKEIHYKIVNGELVAQ